MPAGWNRYSGSVLIPDQAPGDNTTHMQTEKYIVQLDGLRFFAVLMVMVAHWLQWQWVHPALTGFPFVHGVTLFFVLSGFLITRILLVHRDRYHETSTPIGGLFKSFYIRRFLRIFPIYYLLLFLLFAMDYKNTREVFPWLITYTSNIYQSIHNVYIGDFNHFWSLAVEEQFYLFWPLLMLLVPPRRTHTAIMLTIIIALATKVYIYYFIHGWMANSYFTLACMHALGTGALLAWVVLYRPALADRLARPVWLYMMAGVYILLLGLQIKFKLAWYKEMVDEFLFAVTAGFVILRASRNEFTFIAKRILEHPFVVYSGKVTYGMYVYHLFVPALFYYIAPRIGLSVSNKYTLFVAFYLLTLLVAHLSWKFIESPINNLKSRAPYLKKRSHT